MSYPDIGAVILDATFDKMEPLAVSRMPDLLSACTQHTRPSTVLLYGLFSTSSSRVEGYAKDMVKEHFAMDIAEQIS